MRLPVHVTKNAEQIGKKVREWAEMQRQAIQLEVARETYDATGDVDAVVSVAGRVRDDDMGEV